MKRLSFLLAFAVILSVCSFASSPPDYGLKKENKECIFKEKSTSASQVVITAVSQAETTVISENYQPVTVSQKEYINYTQPTRFTAPLCGIPRRSGDDFYTLYALNKIYKSPDKTAENKLYLPFDHGPEK